MVKLCATVLGSDHASLVVAPVGGVGIDGDRGYTLSNSSHELLLTLGLDRVDMGDADRAVVFGEAFLCASLVGIILLKRDTTIIKDVVEAVVRPSTAAAH